MSFFLNSFTDVQLSFGEESRAKAVQGTLQIGHNPLRPSQQRSVFSYWTHVVLEWPSGRLSKNESAFVEASLADPRFMSAVEFHENA